jgi:hypothetical protein
MLLTYKQQALATLNVPGSAMILTVLQFATLFVSLLSATLHALSPRMQFAM